MFSYVGLPKFNIGDQSPLGGGTSPGKCQERFSPQQIVLNKPKIIHIHGPHWTYLVKDSAKLDRVDQNTFSTSEQEGEQYYQRSITAYWLAILCLIKDDYVLLFWIGQIQGGILVAVSAALEQDLTGEAALHEVEHEFST